MAALLFQHIKESLVLLEENSTTNLQRLPFADVK
jgi:hypothetical protein